MVKETILGVIDPSHLPTTIKIIGIYQDEPVEALGSGNTEPDGSGVGTPTAYVRAERAGPGTGRIYFISFTATNTLGAQCSSAVSVWVPHDQGHDDRRAQQKHREHRSTQFAVPPDCGLHRPHALADHDVDRQNARRAEVACRAGRGRGSVSARCRTQARSIWLARGRSSPSR